MSWSQQADSQVNNIDNLDWYSSFFQNDYMENNYLDDLNLQEIPQEVTYQQQYDHNQINSSMINATVQQNIYTIQEESQENMCNQTSKNNLSIINTPKNKSQVNNVQNQIQNNSIQMQRNNSILLSSNTPQGSWKSQVMISDISQKTNNEGDLNQNELCVEISQLVISNEDKDQQSINQQNQGYQKDITPQVPKVDQFKISYKESLEEEQEQYQQNKIRHEDIPIQYQQEQDTKICKQSDNNYCQHQQKLENQQNQNILKDIVLQQDIQPEKSQESKYEQKYEQQLHNQQQQNQQFKQDSPFEEESLKKLSSSEKQNQQPNQKQPLQEYIQSINKNNNSTPQESTQKKIPSQTNENECQQLQQMCLLKEQPKIQENWKCQQENQTFQKDLPFSKEKSFKTSFYDYKEKQLNQQQNQQKQQQNQKNIIDSPIKQEIKFNVCQCQQQKQYQQFDQLLLQKQIDKKENPNQSEVLPKASTSNFKQQQKQKDQIEQQQQYQQQKFQVQWTDDKLNQSLINQKAKTSSKKIQKFSKDFILDSFIEIPIKAQKQKIEEAQINNVQKDIQVLKEENSLFKKQNLHQNLIQINQYFEGMKFDQQKKDAKQQVQGKENTKFNLIEEKSNDKKPKTIENLRSSHNNQFQIQNQNNQILNTQVVIVDQQKLKKENPLSFDLSQKNNSQLIIKGLNIQLPELNFDKCFKTKQKRMPSEENNNDFSQISMNVQTNQDQAKEITKSQTLKDKNNFGELKIGNNLNFDNLFHEKVMKQELKFTFNKSKNLDQKCLQQQNNFDFRGRNNLKTIEEFQDQFNSVNCQLDSILQKSIEQKWDAQYIQEEKNNINRDLEEIQKLIKKLI